MNKKRTSLGRALGCEPLEPRQMLSGGRLVWNDTSQLTLSLAPEGTDIGGAGSELFALGERVGSQRQWTDALLLGFQQWLRHTPLNVGVVADNGAPLGTPGPRTQDPRFGDIRIGARPLGAESLALGVSANTVISGTWAGDVVFNSKAAIESLDQFYALALHEAGHVFGLPHSDNPRSVMYEQGKLRASRLSDEDIRAIIDIHGRRVPDPYEGEENNDTIARAAPLSNLTGPAGRAFVAYADITSDVDVDYYVLPPVRRPGDHWTIRVQTEGVSLLHPMAEIVTADGQRVASSRSTRAGGATLSLQADAVAGDRPLLLKVRAADRQFGVGGYTLILSQSFVPEQDAAQLDALAVVRDRNLPASEVAALLADRKHLIGNELRLDDVQQDAAPAAAALGQDIPRRFQSVASISSGRDVDFYRFDTNSLPDDDPAYLNLTLRSLDPAGLIPSIQLFNQRQEPVPLDVLVNGSGELTVQADLRPNQNYFVRVSAREQPGPFARGNYRLTIDLVDQWVELHQFARGATQPLAADPRRNVETLRLFVAQTQLWHWVLDASGTEDRNATAAVALLLNDQGQVIQRLGAPVGETRSLTGLFLEPGQYSVVILGMSADAGEMASVKYRLRGAAFSEPFGVDPDDPTEDPLFGCPEDDELFCYPGGVVSEEPFLWEEFLEGLEEIPDLTPEELISALLGDWWRWYWNEIAGQNGPALTVDDNYLVPSSGALIVPAELGVLTNDIDPDEDPLAAVLITGPAHGTLSLAADGSFTYVADQGFVGLDQFHYLAYDFIGQSQTATVFLDVPGEATEPADFNQDGFVDIQDLDLACEAVIQGETASQFDLDQSGTVDHQDVQFLVGSVLESVTGDVNLDGRFDSADLISVFQTGRYEAGNDGATFWSAGDWNCDGQFDSGDLIEAFQQGAYTAAALAEEDLPSDAS